MNFDEASRLAGKLYGSILLRNADKEGFDSTVYKLLDNTAPLSIINDMINSEEFILRFLIKRPVIEIVSKLTFSFCGWEPSKIDIERKAMLVYMSGYEIFADELVKDTMKFNGANHIPNLSGAFC